MRKKYAKFKRITDIPLNYFTDRYVKCIMLDIDSTLMFWRSTKIGAEELKWCNNIIFNGIDIILVSNAKKNRASKIAEQLNIKFVSPAYKPWPFGIYKAARKCKTKIKECIMIGDQIVTDRTAAFLSGVRFILVDPLSDIEMGLTKINRWIERNIFGREII